MGCDIHLVLEKHDKCQDCWVGVRSYRYLESTILSEKVERGYIGFRINQRDYDFFNDLCGVRGEGSAFGHEPRGLPEDMSTLTRMELEDDSDLHSHSWLTMAELEPILAKHWDQLLAEQTKKRLTGDEYTRSMVQLLVDSSINNEDDDYNKPSEYRLVFAFDN